MSVSLSVHNEFYKVLICSEYEIEALKVTMSVCLSIERVYDLMLLSGFLMLLQSTSLLMLMLFMQHTISIDCNRTYEDVYKCCQLKYLHTKAAASMKQFCTLLGVCYHDKPINPLKRLFMVKI